ncbi:hypothetical protein FDECE_3566 [Fusarium decemcellulare]|nr:hypothetical protein FDECE_3566 [Fusarium decemcellulare]
MSYPDKTAKGQVPRLVVPARRLHAAEAYAPATSDYHSQSENERPRYEPPRPRRGSTSSISSLDPVESEFDEYDVESPLPYEVTIADLSGVPGPNEIEESDSELKSDDAASNLEDSTTSLNIHRAPITGHGLPNLSPGLYATLSPQRSEVSDLGNRLDDLRLDSRPGSPIQEPGWPPETPLQDKLLAHYQTPQSGSKGFFPRGHIRKVIREPAVREELLDNLPRASNAKIEEFTRLICRPRYKKRPSDGTSLKFNLYRRIFAILVLTEKVNCIGDFIHEGVDDSTLPLRKVPLASSGMLARFELRPRHPNSGRLSCFKRWSQTQLMKFDEWQWSVMAAFFSRGGDGMICRYRFPDSTILPFYKDSYEEREGGFGKVSKVRIHPDHHNFPDAQSPNSFFAIKKLKSRKIAEFKEEFRMLAAFSKNEHPHLVPLRAGYRLREACYFIFDWADSDLSRYWWKEEPHPTFNRETVLWVAKQCAGLASGLQQIHRIGSMEQERYEADPGYTSSPARQYTMKKKLYGSHGDIKPANILLFKDGSGQRGTLKICDFGQAELHTIHSRSNKSKNDIVISLSYRPPECDIHDGTISRSFDVWTMGCLYLEFLIWLLGGWPRVRTFTIKRAGPMIASAPQFQEYLFFDRVDGGKTAEVKPAVTQFIESLHCDPNCSQFVHDFLDYIEDRCSPLANKLQELYDKCERIPGYADYPVPRSPI